MTEDMQNSRRLNGAGTCCRLERSMINWPEVDRIDLCAILSTHPCNQSLIYLNDYEEKEK